MHESKVSRNNSSYKSSSSAISHSSSSVATNVNAHNNNNNSSVGGGGGGGAGATNKKDGKHGSGKNKRNLENNDENSASAMSNISTYSLIDDDHIDDQETINVGNLIIDLESDLEKEKIENEQASIKPDTCTTIANSSSSTTYSLGTSPNLCNTTVTPTTQTRASSSSSSSTPVATSTKSQSAARSSQKSSNKHSSSNATTSSNKNNNNNSNATNSISTSNNNNCSNESNNVSNGSLINSSSVIGSGGVVGSVNIGNGHLMTTRTVFKSSADERGELKMRITRETKPGKSEHKIITSPNHQKSPISSSSTGAGGLHQSICDDSTMTFSGSDLDKGAAPPCTSLQLQKQSYPQATDTTSISSTKECGTSTSIGTITEPECLGPCEPGTSVTLEGIVWQETEGGILVVNVTWRGKTYVGALLDCTRHDWAPPRLCDSPASDIDLKSSKGVRPKRIVTRSNGIGVDEKNLLQTTGKLRNGKGRRILNDPATSNKRQRESDKSSESAPNEAGSSSTSMSNSETTACVPMKVDGSSNDKSTPATTVSSTATVATTSSSSTTDKMLMDKGPNSPMLIGCTEPNCSKKYRNMNGLLYHQTHAHGAESDSKTPGSPPATVSDDASAGSSTVSAVAASPDKDSKNKGTSELKNIIIGGDSKSPPDVQFMQEKLSPEAKRFHRADTRSPSPRLDSNSKPSSASNSSFKPVMSISAEPNQRHGSAPLPHDSPRSNIKIGDPDRRNFQNHTMSSIINPDPLSFQQHRRSPGAMRQSSSSAMGPGLPPQPMPPLGSDTGLPSHASSGNHHPHSHPPSSSKSSSSKQQQLNQPPPLPATTEEGMKPSGTSTGPPPAPHQANCFFNSAFLANSYAYGLPPYFPRQMFDQVTPPPLQPSPAFLTRFMSNIRVPPPPDSPSRMLSPSIPKNLQFPQYKIDPLSIPLSVPNTQFPPNPPLPHNISSMTNPPPLASSSPHLRMPSHGDPMLPPTSQAPFLPPTSVNPPQGLPGPANPMGPMGGPQVPRLVDDPMKQFPRHFN